jgi:ABC-2 type transport system permease protein
MTDAAITTHPATQTNSARHVARLFRTEMRLFLREPQVLVFVIGFPALTVLVLGGVFGTDTNDSGFEYINPSHFYAAAYFGVVLASIGLIMLPARVASYREQGVLRRYDTAGFSRWVFPAVQYLCGLAFSLIGFASLLVTAQFGGDGIPPLEDASATLAGLALGTLAFVSIGVALGMLYPTARAASGLGLALFFPMFLLAGGGPPPEALTDGMRSVADWLPLTHVIRAAQEPWLGIGDGRDHLVIVVGILIAATATWLWRAERVSREA